MATNTQPGGSSFDEITQAIISGRYVCWSSQYSGGVVLGVEQPEFLIMQACPMKHKPFKTGFTQAVALGYTFTIHGLSPDDWAS